MKEATGELNATVVVVVLIAALSAFFFGFLWPMIRQNMTTNYRCSDAICESTPDANGWVDCTYYTFELNGINTDHTADSVELQCPYQG